MTVDELNVLITANTDSLRKGLNEAQKDIKDLQKTATKSSSSIVSAVIKGNIATKLLSKSIQLLSNYMGDAITRLDALNNFPKVMSNLGISSEDANASMKRLSDGLLGLPTSLDQATLSVQRFTSANGNVKASTEMFLALNNAILAGGADMSIQKSALEQLSQAYAKGKPDMMEWRTALMSMPAQLKQVAIAMGYVDANQLGEALRSGKVSMDEFMVKIVELNKNGANGFKSFEEQARNSTGGVKTSIINVKTAITRGLAEIMNAIGQSNIAGFFQMIAKAINSVIPYITAFIRLIVTGISLIGGLFGKTKKTAQSVEKTATSMGDLGSSAKSTAKDMDKTTGSAKKLNKELKGLASFDEMNVLKEPSDSSSGGGDSDSGSIGGGNLGAIDLSAFDTSLDGAKSKTDVIFEKMKDAVKSFADYINGLGFNKIIDHIMGIKDSLVDIFNDPRVQNSAKNWVQATINDFKSIVGGVAQIGLSAGELFYGSVDNYFKANKDRVAGFISSMFDISGRTKEIEGRLYKSLGEISKVFTSGTAKQIGADIISMFANPFMSLTETFGSFITDMQNLLVTPISDNVELIKQTFEGTFEAIKPFFDTLSEAFTYIGDTINTVYNQHFKPFFDSLTKGLSDTFKKVLEVYNQYVQPFIKRVSEGFKQLWDTCLKPLWDSIAGLIGDVVDLLKVLWENWIKPLVDWIVVHIVPILVPIFETIWNVAKTVIGAIGNLIKTIIDILRGVIQFITGVFSGDWSKAWEGIKNIFKPIPEFFHNQFKNAWEGVKKVFSTGGKIFDGIKDGIVNAFTTIVNGIIKGINKVIALPFKAINKVLSKIHDVSVAGVHPFKWVHTFDIPEIPTIKLARGGVVDKPTYAQIGEAGKEVVMPLENNTGWINELADKINTAGGKQPLHVTVNLGDDTLVDKIIDDVKEKSFETNGEVSFVL